MYFCARILKLAIASFKIRLADFEPSAFRRWARKSATSGSNLSHKNSIHWIFMRELAYFESSAARRRARKYATFAKRRWMRLYDRRCTDLRLATGGCAIASFKIRVLRPPGGGKGNGQENGLRGGLSCRRSSTLVFIYNYFKNGKVFHVALN